MKTSKIIMFLFLGITAHHVIEKNFTQYNKLFEEYLQQCGAKHLSPAKVFISSELTVGKCACQLMQLWN